LKINQKRRKESVLFKVPSTIIREEFNYLINPLHPVSKKLSIASAQKFAFDPESTPERYFNLPFLFPKKVKKSGLHS